MKSVLLTSWIFYSAVGFFSGAVMYSYWIPKVFCKIDIRKTAADHNPGGMNAIHAAGMGIGLLCIVLDVLKAFIPVLLAVKVGGIREIQLIPVTAAPVLGHVFSPFLKFRGGKGISSLFGALLGLWSLSKIVLLLLVFVVLFKFIIVIHPDSLSVGVSICISFLFSLFQEQSFFVRVAFLAASFIVVLKLAFNPNHEKAGVTLGKPLLRLRAHRSN